MRGGRGWSLRKPRSYRQLHSRGFRRLQPRPPQFCYPKNFVFQTMPEEGRRPLVKALMILPIGLLLWASVHAHEKEQPSNETVAGWVKHPKNPVLGGDLGTCFDISVLKERDTYRMWFSWRPKKSIALVESKDGVKWSKPVVVL